MAAKKKVYMCAVKECPSRAYSRGLCWQHFKRAKEQKTLPKVETILSVTCWCTKKTVKVPRREVMACLTRSCGAKGCEP